MSTAIYMEVHVNKPNKEHDRNHGNEPTGELHTSPAHPPGDAAHEGVADVGGVIGQQTRDTDYTRFTGGAISAERLEAAAAAGIPDNSPNRLCIVDSGAGTSTGPAPFMRNGRRPDTIEYCTDAVWLGI
jgi:hypothetical protein